MLTAPDLIAALGTKPARPVDEAWAQQVVDGVNGYVDDLPHVIPGEWDKRTLLGANMLAQEAYRGGREGGLDVAGALTRAEDPNVERYLRIGRFQKPKAG
jgi:hypothetical protein